MAHELQGTAIVMRRYGGPDVLRPEIVASPSLRLDEIRIRSIGSAVNHSDLEIRAGNWPILTAGPFPYTPGLEVVGEVVDVGAAVPDIRVGDRVITMMQGLGGVRPRRPGGYAEYVTVAASAAATLSASVDPLDMAALGLGSVTAFEGLRKIGDLKDRRIAVTGAAGGVGSAAVAIARALGAEVIGIVSRPEHAEYVRSWVPPGQSLYKILRPARSRPRRSMVFWTPWAASHLPRTWKPCGEAACCLWSAR